MVGSHSTGEAAQHKLIGIGDAYEMAMKESKKGDPLLNARQQEIKNQLRAVDEKLRQVNKKLCGNRGENLPAPARRTV